MSLGALGLSILNTHHLVGVIQILLNSPHSRLALLYEE